MKKVLLGTTALLAAGLLSTSVSAGAVSASNLDVTLGGYGTFKILYKSRESTKLDTDSYRNHAATFDSEISFKGSTTLDSGTSAGIEIQFETGGSGIASDIIDNNFIWLSGTMGKISLGGVAGNAMEVGIARAYSGVGLLGVEKGAHEIGIANTANTNGGENNKVVWVAPAMGGIEVAVNYTPQLVQNTTGNAINTIATKKGEDLLVGLKWTGAMGAATVKVSLGYGTAKAEDITVDKDIDSDDRTRLGFEVSGIGSLTIGGYMLSSSADAALVTPTEDRTNQGIGGKWVSGDWEVGIGWETAKQDQLTEADVNVKSGTDKATRMDIGVTYKLNADMTLKVGYRDEKYDDDANLAADENTTKSFDVKFDWTVGPGVAFGVGLQNYSYTHHLGLATAAKKTGTAAFVMTKVTF